MNRALEQAIAQSSVLTRQQALHAGVSDNVLRRALAAGELVRIASGAYLSASRWRDLDPFGRHLAQLEAALARCPEAVAAAGSAALLWGLPLPGPPPSRPVLLRPRSADRPEPGGRWRWVTSRRAWLDSDESAERSGMPVTTVERTFVDVAREWPLPWALALADAAMRSRMATQGRLLRAAHRRPSAPGHARAVRAAHLADARPESPLESVARGVMAVLRLPAPDIQVWVGELSSEYRVDLLVREHLTVVEVDGRGKYAGTGADPHQRWHDKQRQDRLLELGFEVHRFVARDALRPVSWGRSLLATFDRSRLRHGLPRREWPYPWARGAGAGGGRVTRGLAGGTVAGSARTATS